MRIITHVCSNCGTVVAANELESNRVMKCPRISCQSVLRFEDLPAEKLNYFLENRSNYQI
ncbi:hypothetical protein [Haloarcula montana]|uniref:hypothetical protein n=1 Tax=Haloarcula montana TaxID=3111776 RepID=UPI003DA9117D